MPFHCTIRCRCGHKSEFRFPDWQTDQEMLKRARYTVCGADGLQNLAFERAMFLKRYRPKGRGRSGTGKRTQNGDQLRRRAGYWIRLLPLHPYCMQPCVKLGRRCCI